MDDRDRDDRDRKGKRPVVTSEPEESAVWNWQILEKWQTTILKASYVISKDPTTEAMAELASMTGLTHSQVEIWFNNKRCVRRRFYEGESSNPKPQQASSLENITRDEPSQDVERTVHMPMWRHGRLVRAGVMIVYRRRRRRQQSSTQQDSRSMPVDENQCAHGTDNNMGEDLVNTPVAPGDLEQDPIKQEGNSDSATE